MLLSLSFTLGFIVLVDLVSAGALLAKHDTWRVLIKIPLLLTSGLSSISLHAALSCSFEHKTICAFEDKNVLL